MTKPATSSIVAKLDQYENQFKQVRDLAVKTEALESKFNNNSAQILNNFPALSQFTKEYEACRLQSTQIEDLTQNPVLGEISALIRGKLEQIHLKITSASTPPVSTPVNPKVALLGIADKFRNHRTREAMSEFEQFATQFPSLVGNVYKNLWVLKGSPTNLHDNYGHRAFHGRDGFFSQDNEKAEAILLLYSSVEDRLNECVDLLSAGRDTEALAKFRALGAIYPKSADTVFGKLWKVYGGPTPQSRPDIAHDRFGTLAFYNNHSKLASEPLKKADAIKQALPEIKQQLADPKICSEQNRSRRDFRCVEVIGEHLAILKQGSYVSPSGDVIDIRIPLWNSIAQTRICRDGGSTAPRPARFAETLFEVRPQNCVTIAIALASDGANKVNVMNFANSHVPGGAYLHHAGSQEEELFRCTGLPLALDQTHQSKNTGFYPIHKTAGALGGVYTQSTPLFRHGLDKDYQLLEKPVTISVGTFAAFDHPKLDFSNRNEPKLQGEELRITREKVRTYANSAYDKGDDTLIMGAFGGGAFANPPGHIVELIMDVLNTEYRGCFKKIVFAIMKDNAEGHAHNPQGNFIPFANTVRQHGGKVYGVNGELL